MNGTTQHEGRLEIRRNGGPWGTIHGEVWSPRHTAIACRSFGLEPLPSALEHTFEFGAGTGPVHTTVRRCYGTERELMQCNSMPWDESHPSANHCCDVGIFCITAGKSYDSKGRVVLFATLKGDEVMIKPNNFLCIHF